MHKMDMFMENQRNKKLLEIMVLGILAFFAARVNIFGMLFVFSIGILGVNYNQWQHTQLIGVSSILGLLSIQNPSMTMKYIGIIFIAMAASLVLNYLKKVDYTRHQQGFIVSMITLVVSVGFLLFGGHVIYDVVIGLLESLLVYILVVLFSYSKDLLIKNKGRTQFSQEEIIAIILFLSISIVGSYGIEIWIISLFTILTTFSLVYVGHIYGAGMGAALGVTLGIILNVTTVKDPPMLVCLAILGLISGALNKLEKAISGGVAIFAALIYVLYAYDMAGVLYQLIPMALAFLLFYFVPGHDNKTKKGFRKRMDATKNDYMERVQELTSERLREFSQTFDELAVTFDTISDKKMSLDQKDINNLIDEVARQVCDGCDHKKNCWENNFYSTYQTIRNILDAADKNGYIAYGDISDKFYKQCYKYKDFIVATNRVYEIYRVNINWHNKMIENRQMVSDQLKGIAGVMNTLSADITKNIQFYMDIEDKIRWQLDLEEIHPEKVFLYRYFSNVMELELIIKDKYLSTKQQRVIREVAEELMDVPLVMDRRHHVGKNLYKVIFKQKKQFRVTTGVAAVSKEALSGDNFTSVQISEDQYLIALSDGMGTGYMANRQSTTTIELLERLMQSGFDHKTAIKMINSLLILKSEEATFSTLDISMVNLHSGECQVTKIGGSTIFIMGNEKLKIINSTSLPVGIVKGVDPDYFDITLEHGDFIVMITDGIMDQLQKEHEDGAEAFLHLFDQLESNNPKEIANQLLNDITHHGEIVSDDMTIVVNRIWKER